MFRPMRRIRQQLTDAECADILQQQDYGVLAVMGDGGYPYAVPLNYAYLDGKLLFHCAQSGHKLDAIETDPRVSFCVVERHRVVPEKLATDFRSVVVFGVARILEGEQKRRAIELFAERYSADRDGRLKEIDEQIDRLCMIELVPEHITGKRSGI